jgi:uncharacterized protein involved in outer membrane biogenesis
LQKLLFGFLFVFIGLIGSILVAPSFVEWNEYKSFLERKINTKTGLNAEIRGDIKIKFFPTPTLLVNNVSVANIEGAAAADMLSVESFEIRVALAPLLRRQLQINTVKLVKPILSLEILSDGRTNMDSHKLGTVQPLRDNKDNSKSKPRSPSLNFFDSLVGSAETKILALRLDNFEIENGFLTYRNTIKGQLEVIKNINAKLELESLLGPMQSLGSAVIRGVPVSFLATTGVLIKGRTLPVNLNLKIVPGEVNLNFFGALTRLNNDPQVKGKFDLDGKNFTQFISAFTGGLDLPKGFGSTFSSTANIESTVVGGRVSNLIVKLNDTQGKGSVDVKFNNVTDLNVQLAFNKINLDTLLFPLMVDNKPSNSKAVTTNKKLSSADFKKPQPSSIKDTPVIKASSVSLTSLTKNMSATLNLSAAAIVFNKSIIRQVKINATAEDQEITISQASALLPGSTDLGLQGIIFNGAKNKKVRFIGTVDIVTNNLRELLASGGRDVLFFPKNRLRKLDFNGKVLLDSNAATLSRIVLQLDETKMTGGLDVLFKLRPSFRADLNVDRLNLDTYWPEKKVGKEVQKPVVKNPIISKIKPQLNVENIVTKAVASNFLAPLATFGIFNANLNIGFKTLIVKNIPIKGLKLKAKIFDGNLNILEFKTVNAAGLKLDLSGNITGLKPTNGIFDPKFENFKFDISSRSLARLLSLAKIKPLITASQIGAIRLYGTMNGMPKALNISANSSMLGAKFTFKGLVAPSIDEFTVDGKFSLVHPNLVKLVKRLSGSYGSLQKKMGGVDMRGRLKYNPLKLILSRLSGQVANIKIEGDLASYFNSNIPKIIANIKTGEIVIDDILSAQKLVNFDSPLQNPKYFVEVKPLFVRAPFNGLARNRNINPLYINAAAKGIVTGAPWTREVIDFSYLKKFDLDIQLRSKSLSLKAYRIEQVDLAVSMTPEKIDLRRLIGKIYGGAFKIDGVLINKQPQIKIQTRFNVAGADAGKFFKSFGTLGFQNGKLDMAGNFTTRGQSTFNLANELSGEGSIFIRELNISSKTTKGFTLSGFSSLFLAAQKFGGILSGGKLGSKQVEFNTNFRMDKGIAVFEDMALKSSIGEGSAKGFVDLPRWQINTIGQIRLAEDLASKFLFNNITKSALLPFKILGRLDDPKVNLETVELTKRGIRLPGSLNKKLNKFIQKKGFGGIINKIIPKTNSREIDIGTPSSQLSTQPKRTNEPKVEDFLKGIFKSIRR